MMDRKLQAVPYNYCVWTLLKSVGFQHFPQVLLSLQVENWGRQICLSQAHWRRHPTFCCSTAARISGSHHHPDLPNQGPGVTPATLAPTWRWRQTSSACPPWHPMAGGGLAGGSKFLPSRWPITSAPHFAWREGAGSRCLSPTRLQSLPCRGPLLIKRHNCEPSLRPVWCEAICVPEEEGQIQHWLGGVGSGGEREGKCFCLFK